jgi:uncharacterized protein HemX
MFGIPKLYAILGAIIALGAAVAWHERQVHNFKEEILTEERARVKEASDKLLREEAAKAADNAAESEREAAMHEEAMAAKDHEIDEANLKIVALEKENSKCGFVSRETVRKINSSR